jgi:L-lactate dehydrogenase
VAAAVRVGIVGTGWVGASVAISVLHGGQVQELLLNDAREGLAEGEAMDLAHGAAFLPAASVRSAGLDEMRDTDAVVIAAGRGGRASETRLDLLRDNARVVRDIGSRLRGYRGVIVVVTNPVDVLTAEVTVASGLPPARVLGTGTMLDTARLRHVVSRRLQVDARSIHAHVIGEHGDSELVVWSSARVAGVPLAQFPGWSADAEREVASEVRLAAYEIIRRKGATNHAIGLVTATLLRAILRGENRVLTVSRVQSGAAGLVDVALSLPAVVGTGGATHVIVPDMDTAETAALAGSAAVLREARESLRASEG